MTALAGACQEVVLAVLFCILHGQSRCADRRNRASERSPTRHRATRSHITWKGFATKEDLRDEGERSRRYVKVLVAVYDTINRALDRARTHPARMCRRARHQPIR